MNEYRICNKCKGVSFEYLIKEIKKIDNNPNIILGCSNMCGIGKFKNFVIFNKVPIVADSKEELILKIKEKLNQEI